MRQQLENMEGIYQPRQMQKAISDRQRVYTIGDLESLSATVLYSEIKKGDSIKSNDRNLNFYHFTTPLNFGETEVGYQNDGEKHPAFKRRMIKGGGYRIKPTIKSGS